MKLWFDTVSTNQEIFIKGEKYICKGIALCESNSSIFCDFAIFNSLNNEHKYLCVEKENGENYEVYVYSDISKNEYNSLISSEFTYSEVFNERVKIKKCIGSFDADIGETYSSTDNYINGKALSKEEWYEETCYSYGFQIELQDITLGCKVNRNVKSSGCLKPLVIICLVLFLPVIILFSSLSGLFASYCSPTCSKTYKDVCCQNVSRCLKTGKVCKSIKYTLSNSVRYGSLGTRTPVGGGTTFGK